MGYQIMFYGGLAGVFITLPIVIWLFLKLEIIQVVEDLTGIRLHRAKKQNYPFNGRTARTGKRTTSEIRLKKENAHPEIASSHETELLEETSLLTNEQELEETTLLSSDDETTLLTESELAFMIEEDIMIVHSDRKI
ncbi:hypothetical protein [Aquibacillus rhizosphaerae]|uniref:Uncharacterized protein n=1 Tax=Aquibacillus rhizosphaerae TaxID=3051431 RepID=A0ABT7L0Q8_9BACI|nr:hypothetical protein [Aquibacillus sp. LR5S19]MDL4838924.1 hypothetical protein [Aquibacillus sp. LR5S19]